VVVVVICVCCDLFTVFRPLIRLRAPSFRTSYLPQSQVLEQWEWVGWSLAPPALRSQRGLLTVDVVLETEDTFFLVTSSTTSRCVNWCGCNEYVRAHVWKGREECAYVVVVVVVIEVGC
jgi:hypothetical protein